MTESEELKQNAERQRVLDQFKAVNTYLDSLAVQILDHTKKSDRAWLIYLVVGATWILAGIWNPTAGDIGNVAFLLSLMYAYYRSVLLIGAYAEFKGAIKILELLGMIPPSDEGEREVKRAPFWAKGRAIVKKWKIQKAKAIEGAYQPA